MKIKLKKKMSAITIDENLNINLYLHDQDGNDNVSKQNYLAAGLSISLKEKKYYKKITKILKKMFKEKRENISPSN